MTTLNPALAPTSSEPRRSPLLALAVLVPFTVFSLWVVATRGYTGFLSLSGREPWALQMLIDLSLALVLGVRWMAGDARKRGIAIWPFVILCVFLGSIGWLAYWVRSCFPAKPRA